MPFGIVDFVIVFCAVAIGTPVLMVYGVHKALKRRGYYDD